MDWLSQSSPGANPIYSTKLCGWHGNGPEEAGNQQFPTKSTRDWRPGPDTPIYRSVEREQNEKKKNLFANQARHLTVMNFGGEYHGRNNVLDLDFCGVELYVQEGKL